MKNYIIGAIIIGVFALVGANLNGVEIKFGASSGPDHYNQEYFFAGAVLGGDYTTETTATSSFTVTAQQICDSAVISWAVSAGNDTGTTTLPTSASLTSVCLPRDGDTKTVLFRNSAPATTTVFVAGTLMIMVEPENGDVDLDATGTAMITFVRASSTEVIAIVTEQLDAD